MLLKQNAQARKKANTIFPLVYAVLLLNFAPPPIWRKNAFWTPHRYNASTECKVITKKKKFNESSSSRSSSSSSSIRSTFFRQKNLYVRDTRARIDIFYIRGNIVGKRAVGWADDDEDDGEY